jgi:biotin carboxyl carrier protein
MGLKRTIAAPRGHYPLHWKQWVATNNDTISKGALLGMYTTTAQNGQETTHELRSEFEGKLVELNVKEGDLVKDRR